MFLDILTFIGNVSRGIYVKWQLEICIFLCHLPLYLYVLKLFTVGSSRNSINYTTFRNEMQESKRE